MSRLEGLRDALKPDSFFWRRAISGGVNFAPHAFVRYSPPLFGLAWGAVLPKKRDIVRKNLRRALGPRSPAVEARDVASVFVNYACCLTEALLLGSNRGYKLTRKARDVERFFACAAEGRGVIVATAHTGGWEIAGPVLSGVHKGEVVVVMQRERDERARAIQDEARERAGVKVLHIGEGPLDALALLQRLRKGSVVAMQVDRVPPGMRGRTASMFGEAWQVPEGPLKLAAASGAPIVPVFTRRLGFMSYEAIVAEPVRLSRRPSSEELDAAAGKIAGALEGFIRQNPTQWFHFV